MFAPAFAAVLAFAASDPIDESAPGDEDDAAPHAPCGAAPAGMVCIAGGDAIVGSNTLPNEKPRRTVDLDTFYLDVREVSVGDYQACVDAGSCRPLSAAGAAAGTVSAATEGGKKKPAKKTLDPALPALTSDWQFAQRYCAWAGKRLPTEFEWEKAARGKDGALYPVASVDDITPPSCSVAHAKGCTPRGLLPVQSLPAGRHGLFDMAGNAAEWTATWAGSVDAPCGAACRGRDPRGPCDGAFPCDKGGGKKIVKGGSVETPAALLRGSVRRAQLIKGGTQKNGFRCATSLPALTTFPPRQLTQKPAPPPAPTPPTEEQRAIFTAIAEDDLEKQECPDKGRSFIDCRDPTSYIRSNEPRQHVWKPYVENLGGGYVGVGIDQNYNFIAAARSQWVWLFDYDPTVVRLHFVLRALILAAPDRQSFTALFEEANKQKALQILSETYQGKAERAAYREVYGISRKALHGYYLRQLDGTRDDATFGWLASDEAYSYVRLLHQQGRVHILKGDMLKAKSMQGIAKAARALGVTIRVYYPSNAPECWPHTKQYKKNVRALPFDERSVVLQTLSGMKAGYGKSIGYWHYNVQSGLLQQSLMGKRGYLSLKQVVYERIKTDDPDLSILGLPAG